MSKTYERHGWTVRRVATRHWLGESSQWDGAREHFTTRKEAYQFIDAVTERLAFADRREMCIGTQGGSFEFTGRRVITRCPMCGPVGEFASMTEAEAAMRVHRRRAGVTTGAGA